MEKKTTDTFNALDIISPKLKETVEKLTNLPGIEKLEELKETVEKHKDLHGKYSQLNSHHGLTNVNKNYELEELRNIVKILSNIEKLLQK